MIPRRDHSVSSATIRRTNCGRISWQARRSGRKASGSGRTASFPGFTITASVTLGRKSRRRSEFFQMFLMQIHHVFKPFFPVSAAGDLLSGRHFIQSADFCKTPEPFRVESRNAGLIIQINSAQVRIMFPHETDSVRQVFLIKPLGAPRLLTGVPLTAAVRTNLWTGINPCRIIRERLFSMM